MFVEIAEVYLATLGHTLDDSAEKDVDNSGDVLTLGVKFFRPATIRIDNRKKLKDQFPADSDSNRSSLPDQNFFE
jgi:hypothetical protein